MFIKKIPWSKIFESYIVCLIFTAPFSNIFLENILIIVVMIPVCLIFLLGYWEYKEKNKKGFLLNPLWWEYFATPERLRKKIINGADVNSVDYSQGMYYPYDFQRMTPLKYACQTNDDRFVEILIDYGADISKNSAFSKACTYPNLRTIKLFLDNGADVNEDHGSPLECAIYNRYIDIVKLLLEHGAKKYIYCYYEHTNRYSSPYYAAREVLHQDLDQTQKEIAREIYKLFDPLEILRSKYNIPKEHRLKQKNSYICEELDPFDKVICSYEIHEKLDGKEISFEFKKIRKT